MDRDAQQPALVVGADPSCEIQRRNRRQNAILIDPQSTGLRRDQQTTIRCKGQSGRRRDVRDSGVAETRGQGDAFDLRCGSEEKHTDQQNPR
jgi:hypothetical protein